MLFSSNPTPSLPSFILFVFLYIFPLFSSVFSSLSFPLTSFFFGFIFAPLLFAFPLFLPFSYIFPAFLLFLEFNRFVQLLLRLPFSLAICFLFFFVSPAFFAHCLSCLLVCSLLLILLLHFFLSQSWT